MQRTRGTARFVACGLIALGLAAFAGRTLAHIDGMTGYTQSPTGCSCHGSSPNGNGAVSVTITGPGSVLPGSTHSYTVTVLGGPAGDTGGFDLKATGGTLIAGQGTQVLGNEITHIDNPWRSWTFDWTAPASNGNVSFYAIGQATNGAGTSGDSWNFYGGAVNTAFPIQVSNLVGVAPQGTVGLALGAPAPNPTRAGAQVAWVLPADGPATLTVRDARGRRVAVLAAGSQAAGRHVSAWDGRTERGAQAPAGAYLVQLDAAQGSRTVRLVLLR